MAAARPDITAVVVTYNSAESLKDCLQRLRKSRGLARIVVVDNGSGDDSFDIALTQAEQDKRIEIFRLPLNPGFATACNVGAAGVAQAWLAFVNPDCLLEPDSLANLRDLAKAMPDCGVLGADLVDASGQRDGAARRRDPDSCALLRGLGQRERLAIAPDDSLALQPVDAVSGALMLMPRAVFEQVGGFDPRYRLHAEDLDLCRRVRQAGYRVAVANGVRVVHLRGTSSRRRPIWVEWQKHRGMWRYFARFERNALPWRLLLALAIALRFVFAASRALIRAG